MKATLLTSAIALLALSATAAPQQTTQQAAPAEQQAANVPQQAISQPAPPQTGDSPLVAAAKRANRLGKKPATVITNESLVKSGGHFTTTKSQDNLSSQAAAGSNPLPTPAVTPTKAPPPPPSKKADPKAAENKEKALKRAVADYLGESIEEVNDDPSTQEAVASKGVQVQQPEAPKPAQAPAAAQKPPQF